MNQSAPMNIYDTSVLVAVVPNLLLSQNWLLDRYFGNQVVSDTEFVSIDVEVGQRRMSPFVSPLVAGKMVESRRTETNTFKPAYIKDLRAPDLLRPIRRQVGERIGGVFTAAQREMLNLQYEMADQIDMAHRRMEWMGASALQTGKVTVSGEGFDPVVIDFGRDSALTIALSGDDKWLTEVPAGTEYTKPTEDITDWVTTVLQKSGAVVEDVVFTTSSWKAFAKDTSLKGAIIMPVLNTSGNNINPGTQVKRGAVYKGRWGQLDLWVYNDWFINDKGEEEPMLTDGNVLLSGADLMGTRAFGAILDPEFNYAALAYAPKTWVEKNPAQRQLMMQCAPLVIPSRVNASLCATVV